MSTIFVYSENSKLSNQYRLVFNLMDKMDFKRDDTCVALSDLSIYYSLKDIKNRTEKIDLNIKNNMG